MDADNQLKYFLYDFNLTEWTHKQKNLIESIEIKYSIRFSAK